MGTDQVCKVSQQWLRQIVTHAVNQLQFGAAHEAGCINTPGDRHERIGLAMDHQGRRRNLL